MVYYIHGTGLFSNSLHLIGGIFSSPSADPASRVVTQHIFKMPWGSRYWSGETFWYWAAVFTYYPALLEQSRISQEVDSAELEQEVGKSDAMEDMVSFKT